MNARTPLRSARRATLAAAALIVAPFLLAACGADSDAEAPPAAETAAVESLPEVRYYTISET